MSKLYGLILTLAWWLKTQAIRLENWAEEQEELELANGHRPRPRIVISL